ncbi:MAG: recombinase family protein [Desulfobacteraceae bacterium]|nr:recombinase family protein [Desulfobacteraceae bacterium]
MGKIVGYIRVSTSQQDVENQRHEILEWASAKKVFITEWIECELSSRRSETERQIDKIRSLEKGDKIIVSELSRLGRSTGQVIMLVNDLVRKGVSIEALKQGISIKAGNGEEIDQQSKIMVTVFSLMAELERDLISQRTKTALAARKAAGKSLGKPKGLSSSKLDAHREKIEELLKFQVSHAAIARMLEMSTTAVRHYCISRGLSNK